MSLRLGLMVPANNTTMAAELTDWLDGASCHTLKIPRGKGLLGPAEIPAYVDQALALAKQYDRASTDVVAYGCTAAGFIGGPAMDAKIQAELKTITGRPVVTTANAMVDVLRQIGATRIAVVTPYLDAVNDRLAAYLQQSGIEVVVLNSFKAATTDELAAITADQVAQLARETMRPDCDALFIACSQLPTKDIVAPLERELGKPVWSSIRATAVQVQAITKNIN